GSRMDFQNATHLTAGTGQTMQGQHLSECAKWRPEDIEVLVTSVDPGFHRVPGNARIKESTAFTGGQWFRECCDAARDGLVPEFFVFAPFYIEPSNAIALDPKVDKDLANMVRLSVEERRIVRIAKRGQPKDNIPPFDITPEQLKFRRITLNKAGWDEDLFSQEYPLEYESAWISRDARVFPHDKLFAMKTRYAHTPKRMVRVEPGPRLFDDDNM